jgi:hypothetical protein
MRVSYLTDQQCREAYLQLLDNINEYIYDHELDRTNFWKDLGYDSWDIPYL